MDSKAAEHIIIEFNQSIQVSANARKRKVKPHDLDFNKSAEPGVDDARHSTALLRWLTSLPQKEAEKVLCLQNRWLVAMLQQMLKKKASDGEGSFSLTHSPRVMEVEVLHTYFYFRHKTISSLEHPGPEVAADKELESYLWLVDTSDYLDSLALCKLATSDVPSLIKRMKTLTQDKAFLVPCRTYWVNEFKTWAWESPAWFNKIEFYTLAQWSCLAFERIVWTKFWEVTHTDPRLRGESQRFISEPHSCADFFSEKHSLSEFWESLDIRSRLETIGDLNRYVIEYLETYPIKQKDEVLFKKGKPCAQPFNTGGVSSLVGHFHATSVGIRTLRSKLYSYDTEDCVEQIRTRALEEPASQFIDFLMCSTIDRAGSMLDKIARRVVNLIRQAESAKEAEDLLLLTEEAEQIKKISKKQRGKAKKAKKHKRKLSNASAVSVSSSASVCTTKSSTQEDDTKSVHSTSSSQRCKFDKPESAEVRERSEASVPEPIVELSEETKKIEELDEEFTVKGKKKRVRQKRLKQPVLRLSSSSEPCKKANRESSIDLSKTKSDEIGEESKFMPGQTQFVWRFSPLHFEIQRMVNSTLYSVNLTSASRFAIVQSLTEVVARAFPGTSLELYGSFATGLALGSSDIDLAVVGLQVLSKGDIRKCIAELTNKLLGTPWISKCQGIPTASVPVIKLEVVSPQNPNDIFKVDITIDGGYLSQHMGLSSFNLTKTCMIVYPSLQQLIIVIKLLLEKHGLNSAYEGGLSSYSVVLWCIAYINSLQHKPEDLGTLLLGFLEHYGLIFNPETTGVSIINGG